MLITFALCLKEPKDGTGSLASFGRMNAVELISVPEALNLETDVDEAIVEM